MVAFFLRDQVCALIDWWLDVWFFLSFDFLSRLPYLSFLPWWCFGAMQCNELAFRLPLQEQRFNHLGLLVAKWQLRLTWNGTEHSWYLVWRGWFT